MLDVRAGRRPQVARAVTYVIDPHHVQYCGGLPLEEQARIIARAVGGRGPNTEYLYNTAAHLARAGYQRPRTGMAVARVQRSDRITPWLGAAIRVG